MDVTPGEKTHRPTRSDAGGGSGRTAPPNRSGGDIPGVLAASEVRPLNRPMEGWTARIRRDNQRFSAGHVISVRLALFFVANRSCNCFFQIRLRYSSHAPAFARMVGMSVDFKWLARQPQRQSRKTI